MPFLYSGKGIKQAYTSNNSNAAPTKNINDFDACTQRSQGRCKIIINAESERSDVTWLKKCSVPIRDVPSTDSRRAQ